MRAILIVLLVVPTLCFGDAVSELLGPTTVRVESTTRLDSERMQALERWVRSSAATVALTYGRFPVDRVRVIIRESARAPWGENKAVYFGQTTRRGGGQVELFIAPGAPISDYYSDWTATHEFSHLMLPLLDREDRWISEGFATYYQNVLMARAGRYSSEYAWQRLAAGFERGRESRPDLSPNEAGQAGVRSARMKYYWSGAAFALIADMELRSRSGGKESLDTVLGQLQRCCLPARQRWSGARLFRQLDSFLDEPLFIDLYRRLGDEEGFPDTARQMDDDDLAPIRRSITRQVADLTHSE